MNDFLNHYISVFLFSEKKKSSLDCNMEKQHSYPELQEG